jgi:Na+-driven multidrug efflux pump
MNAFIPFVRKKAILKFVRPHFSAQVIKSILACGSPTFLNNVAGRITAILMNSALIKLGHDLYGDGGTVAVAAYSVLMYVSGIIEPMLYGMSDSVQPAVGYNWGAGDLKRVSGITKVSFTVCGLVSVLCASVMFLFPRPLASVFVDAEKSPALMELAVHAIPYFGLAFLFGWFCFAVQGFFAAIEKPIFATLVSVCFAIITPVALIYALSPMGLDGLWLNYFGRSLLTGIVATVLIVIAQKSMKRDIAKSAAKNE